MTYKLTDIIKMKSGVFAKGDTNPDVYYIQSTDFDSDKKWVENLNPVLSAGPKLEKHILNQGDILFAVKGREFFAVVYDGRYAPAVSSSTFLVLQVKAKNILPEYVVWFLNHSKSQAILWSMARGTAISSITKSTLEQIEIPIPSVSKQNSILEFSNLQKKEKQLQQQIIQLKQVYINELTYKSIQ